MTGIRDFVEKIRHGEAEPSQLLRLPDRRPPPAAVAGQAPAGLTTDQHYFTVTVNGLRLDYERVMAKTYDPLLLAVTEFKYGGEPRSVPFIVGTELVKGATHGVPSGMVFADTRVAGPHPFSGSVGVTVILYRIKRDDYVRRVLDAVQRTCAAFDLSSTLTTYLKIGDAVLDGLDAVLGTQPTQPLLGHRIEFGDGAEPGSFVVAPERLDEAELWLSSGELRQGRDAASATAVSKMSYIAYTLAEGPSVDLQALPWFKPLWSRIVRWANVPTEDGKETAKNYLAALYEEIATSPDVAFGTAEQLYTDLEQKARDIHEVARKRAAWGPSSAREDVVRARALQIRRSA
jgi:hypothetical protein